MSIRAGVLTARCSLLDPRAWKTMAMCTWSSSTRTLRACSASSWISTSRTQPKPPRRRQPSAVPRSRNPRRMIPRRMSPRRMSQRRTSPRRMNPRAMTPRSQTPKVMTPTRMMPRRIRPSRSILMTPTCVCGGSPPCPETNSILRFPLPAIACSSWAARAKPRD